MAVASALITLGDGNWKMGEGVKAVGSKVTDIDEQTILEHYVCKYLLSFDYALVSSECPTR